MNPMYFFAKRNTKEILRDPQSIIFGLGFPLVLLFLLSIINRSIPKEAEMQLFHLPMLLPGVMTFGLSFLALFSATLISKDRTTSFIMRLYVSPLRSRDYIFGYMLPLLPMAVAQMLVGFLAAVLLGLPFSTNAFLCILVCLPMAVIHIALGMICGCLFSEKAVGGICGALLTNLSAWLSGTWFSLDLVGGAFKKVAYCLPFANGVDAGRSALAGNYGAIMKNLWVTLVWAAGLLLIAVLVFSAKRKNGNPSGK